ncbi:hypothetical protein TeGR_g1917 [Tetraparma gracilis]|uniref:Uncharacterized protein n=1 Tax=Tetraparma gracilis TaxID=2962635 RepID=A0ABQ6MN89_9STRA|nr:hypothetical protein TeGR_g1917 [Tetraparma gracilis]
MLALDPSTKTLPSVSSSRSPYDLKEYRQVELANGLRAVLVKDARAMRERGGEWSDEEEEEGDGMEEDGVEEDGMEESGDEDEEDAASAASGKSSGEPDIRFAAVSLLVGVGSYSDPAHLPGLAHFLEHMLFMGTSTYPDENHYDAYVSKHGGSTNAWTEMEETVFHYTTPQAQLFPALDVFARFFSEPLMKADAVDRERRAVDSEFFLSQQSDGARLQQLFCATARPREEHPFRSFSWGNKESLSPEGVDVVAELRRFYDQYYYARNMRLVIIGGYELDELQAQVEAKFGAVPAGPRVPPALPTEHHAGDYSCTSALAALPLPFPPSSLSTVYYAVPIKQAHSLTLTFQMPPQDRHWRSMPLDYLGHLLGHEGAGSCLSLLKARGVASTICAGVGQGGYERASSHWLFQVQVAMSERGVAEVEAILEVVFA